MIEELECTNCYHLDSMHVDEERCTVPNCDCDQLVLWED